MGTNELAAHATRARFPGTMTMTFSLPSKRPRGRQRFRNAGTRRESGMRQGAADRPTQSRFLVRPVSGLGHEVRHLPIA
jgi:hypothetical protein